MYYHAYPPTKATLAERHVAELIEVVEELLAVPELMLFPPDEMFNSTLEVIAKARVLRSAVLDELAHLEDAP